MYRIMVREKGFIGDKYFALAHAESFEEANIEARRVGGMVVTEEQYQRTYFPLQEAQ